MIIISNISLPHPLQQLDFQQALERLRNEYLQNALFDTVEKLDIEKLDKDLNKYVPQDRLKQLAGKGLRGEVMFPVPYLLEHHPQLLGYYRLLFGYSQKEFYSSKTGMSQFKNMEVKNTITEKQKSLLPNVCGALINSASILIDGVGIAKITRELLDDLTLLTLGPQLRGGINNVKGTDAINEVVNIIYEIVRPYVSKKLEKSMELMNAAGRKVVIRFSADPDVTIQEEMAGSGELRNLLAIEVKGGEDVSNIHNRIGEAEKSHLKAFKSGYTDFWTIVNVPNLDIEMAKNESPTTRRFYSLADLLRKNSPENQDFRKRIVGLTGIKELSTKRTLRGKKKK